MSLNLIIIISYLLLALSINDLGSIYSVGGMLKPTHVQRRVTRELSNVAIFIWFLVLSVQLIFHER